MWDSDGKGEGREKIKGSSPTAFPVDLLPVSSEMGCGGVLGDVPPAGNKDAWVLL